MRDVKGMGTKSSQSFGDNGGANEPLSMILANFDFIYVHEPRSEWIFASYLVQTLQPVLARGK
jgi:hypothetical protein